MRSLPRFVIDGNIFLKSTNFHWLVEQLPMYQVYQTCICLFGGNEIKWMISVIRFIGLLLRENDWFWLISKNKTRKSVNWHCSRIFYHLFLTSHKLWNKRSFIKLSISHSFDFWTQKSKPTLTVSFKINLLQMGKYFKDHDLSCSLPDFDTS